MIAELKFFPYCPRNFTNLLQIYIKIYTKTLRIANTTQEKVEQRG